MFLRGMTTVEIGLTIICVGLVLFVIYCFLKTRQDEYELTEDGVQQLADYRTYMINQFICLITFWLNVSADDIETKLVTPGINQNGIYIFKDNLEVYAIFDWETCQVEVKTSVFKESGGYFKRLKTFSLRNGSFPTDTMYDFITSACQVHHDEYEIAAEDVDQVVKQLKDMGDSIDKENVQYKFYEYMANLMLLMRKKKYRNDKQLLELYLGLMLYLWTAHKEEFLKYLEIDEEGEE